MVAEKYDGKELEKAMYELSETAVWYRDPLPVKAIAELRYLAKK